MPPLDGFTYEETFCTAPLRVVRARQVSDGRAALVYEVAGVSLSPTEIDHQLESDTRILALASSAQGLALAIASEGQPLCACQCPLSLTAFFEFSKQLVEALARVHDQFGFYRYLNDTTVLIGHLDTGQSQTAASATSQSDIVPPLIATLLETRLAESPLVGSDGFEGMAHLWRLKFLAPEQTGRMNLAPDARADFYALGVVFYQMLTGRLPFESDDPMELVHHHLARTPLAPHQLSPSVPLALSDLVLKLLAKTPEERYQGTFGLLADLDECARQWRANGQIVPFILGQRDVSEYLTPPSRLYGRESELATLQRAFENVRETGEPSLLLIGGYSGIGKTALAQSLRPLISKTGGYFLAGKIDQFRRNLPYASITEAFRGLIRQLQTEDAERLAHLRAELQLALENNGQVIADVLPEIEQLIGPQPSILEVSPNEAQVRFNRTFQAFIRVVARPGRPIVLFLDDLQWMDAASLKFMETLMESKPNLLLVGAYRDNEVSPSHPLIATVGRIEEAHSARIERLILKPLSTSHVTQLLADILHLSEPEVTPLAQLLVSRTDGNAFFLLQFLQQLHTDSLLRFERNQGRWVWDENQIQHAAISGDVVELMAGKIRNLAPAARAALPEAACLGNRIDIETLALVRGQSRESLQSDLQEALTTGLIVPTNDTQDGSLTSLRFLHDRVQQAAYSLLPKAEKTALHARTGQLLAERAQVEGSSAFEERLFEIVDHQNRGWTPGREESANRELAEINLRAARKAKNALAYDAAAKYALSGIKVLPSTTWQSHHELTLALQLGLCEFEILQGSFSDAQSRLEALHQHARDRFEHTQIYLLQLTAFTTQTRMAEAAQIGITALRQFGVNLPLHPGKATIVQEVLMARRNLGRRRPADILNSPAMSDPNAIAMVQIINGTLAAAFQSDVLLWTLLTLKTVSLALLFGNTTGTPGAFANYAIILCAPLGQFRTGLEFAETAMRLSDRLEYSDARSSTYFTAGAFIAFWHFPMSHGINLLQQSYEFGPQSGEFVYASYSTLHMLFHRLFKGESLSYVDGLIDEYLDFVNRVQYKEGPEYLAFFRQFIACLQGRTEALGSFSNDDYNESKHLQEIGRYVNKLPLMYYTTLKLEALYLLNLPEQARQVAARYERDPKNIEQLSSMLFGPVFHFYNAMTQAALYPQALTRQKRRYRLNLEMTRRRFRKWAQGSPTNFSHLASLLEAEIARLKGDWREAQSRYEDAIDEAEKQGFTHHAALAHERVGTLHLERRSHSRARYHLSSAHQGFLEWGALAKVRDLEARYSAHIKPTLALASKTPEVLPHSLSLDEALAPEDAVSATLDLGTVVKASQAISGEIEWARLLRVLMNIALENAGAQRGVLLIENEGELSVASQGEAGNIEVLPLEGRSLNAEDAHLLPLSVVNYVARTRESIVLSNARTEQLFAHDPFITQRAPRSLLCTPIVNQGHLVGVLYLQNDLAEGAFTEDRLRVLNLLAAQAAVSLEAARAYALMRKSQNQLQAIVDNATTVIYMKDLQGRYLMVNEQFTRLLGTTKEKALGSTAFDFLSPESAQQVIADDVAVLEQHKSLQWEENFPFDGELRTYITAKFPLYDAEGNIYALGGVSTDITERKRAEELLANYNHALEKEVAQRTLELRENNEQLQLTLAQLQDAQQRMILQENLAYLGTLTAGIAHEIQNPLNFVINFAQVSSIIVEDLRGQLQSLQESMQQPLDEYLVETVDDLDQNAAKINEHGQRINKIVKSMLLHSRGISPPPAPTQINALLEESVDLVYHALRAEKPDLNIHFEKHLEPILNEQKISAVAQDLSRVFTNIIGNAAYAVIKGQEANDENFIPTITLTSKTTSENVEIRIRDNGSGIPPVQREEIFKPFFTTKPTGEGTGLGLSICYNIVTQEHQGEIRVESLTKDELKLDTTDENSKETFTEFIICLPRKVVPQSN